MSAALEATVDKFTFRVATDRLYHPDGVWVLRVGSGRLVRLGVTDFVQQRSGDVTFATVRPVGTVLRVGEDVAEIETIKVALALPSPVGGTIVETNPALETTPEVINQDPFGSGWLAVIEASDWDTDCAALLDPGTYFAQMKATAEAEVDDR